MADMRKQLSYTAAEIDERLGSVPNKVDKVTGKGLSTNDYTDADKMAVGTIGDKVDKVEGKGLSTNDYTDAEKTKLSGLTQYTDAMAEAAVFGAKTSISANTDLNNINNAGKFVCSSATTAASLSHCPTGKPFVLLVDFISGSTRMIQRIYAYDSTTGVQENYQRCYIASGWGAWYVTSAGALGVGLTSNTDMNDVIVPGEYRIETSAIAGTITNLPPNTGWTGHVVVQGLNTPTAERLMQIYTPVWANADRDGKVYIRHLKGTNSWSNWFVFSGTAVT